ncbi:hypothetical protein VITFI_CDS1354 [Vitreoscilla filiformis]|uniref:Uncharacterized protein n=1 Tax=Vitreoscilla filiformis TaxID=63 RepID=A0A221KDP1_VITFI|nr:hypothetical protein VITFI_CDS1354 [Vitreoscilla filiformis]
MHGSTGVQAAREGDADALAGGKLLQNGRGHGVVLFEMGMEKPAILPAPPSAPRESTVITPA